MTTKSHPDPARDAPRSLRGFHGALGGVLAAGFVLRLAYLVAQPAVDPTFNRPMLDGLVYLEWARDILAGRGYDGAFYLAPLYPYALAALLRVFGENFAVIYLLQHASVVAAAGLLALVTRRHAGPGAGLATAVLALLYHPLIFFASAPVAESIVLPLMALALWILTGESRQRFPAAGLVVGVAALGRPNLLLLPLAWAGLLAVRRSYRDAALLIAGVAVVVLPVLVRNTLASGHPVPISANSGITAYHGNGPGATGTYTQPRLFSGSPLTQRAEATRAASRLAGQALDPVEADRFWGRQARRARLAEPLGTLRLLAVRSALLIDSHEHGLDYDPMLDRNPWRPTLRWPRTGELGLVPLALLLGLAACGWFLRGFRATGGPWLWWSILACAATPVLFYVSSRYRLPAALLLTIPAGCGAAALFAPRLPQFRRRWFAAVAVGLLWTAASLLVPSDGLQSAQRSEGLSNLASAYKSRGLLDDAERLSREALATGPPSARVHYNLAVVLEAGGQLDEAEAHYRAALRLNNGMAEAAGNLAALLIRRGSAGETISLLRRALAVRPDHATCWNNLVVALAATGRATEARGAARQAEQNGVQLDPGMLLRLLGPATGGE